ncbi:hypothetical protein [Brevundimonas sp.]|uniref:hypothetical protein n=2 Tax=Brevundimonas sp. TaxID=1871086 RepID=UPI0027F2C8D5|nr:hypothetical protein [Brevundimonas sp.]MDQ7812958.1 hypothetical protein [Brevundimonas sp.]
MTRMPAFLLAALLAAAPLSAAAQDRGDRAEARQQERRAATGGGGGVQDRGDRGQSGGQSGGQRERPSREQSVESPRVSVGAAVQRASAGRPGRFLGASNRGDTIVVRWEYPGGRVADIMVDGRTGRVIGER